MSTVIETLLDDDEDVSRLSMVAFLVAMAFVAGGASVSTRRYPVRPVGAFFGLDQLDWRST